MTQKKTGFNTKLRKLFARIQRDFHYPKVFAVYPHIHARVRTWEDKTKLPLRTIEKLTTTAHSLEVDFPTVLVTGSLGSIGCHHAELMESLEASAHSVTCWEPQTIHINRPECIFEKPGIHDVSEPLKLPKVHKQPLAFPLFGIHTTRVQPQTKVLRGINMAMDLPLRLKITPMNSISKKLLIRYRTSVLKSLNISPNQVKFVGVCFGLPAAPLRIMDVARGADGECALAQVVGPVNEMLGRRVWILVQLRDKPRYVPITLKEE